MILTQLPFHSFTTTTATVNGIADARTVATVSGCGPAPVTPSACSTSTFSVQLDNAAFDYSVYFSGANVTENPNNSGATPDGGAGGPVFIQTLPATVDTCGVISNCTTTAAQGVDGSDPLYGSVDVHFDAVAQSWYCVFYANEQNDPSVFNVKAPNVALAYGLSH
jgi:hypothetical protein